MENDRTGKIKEQIRIGALRGLEACASIVEADAVLNCPVHDSLLRNSIYRKLNRSQYTVTVGATAEYAAAVEFGRAPGKKMPPYKALMKWARDVLGSEALAFVVARAIGRKGTKPQPFLRPAIDNNTGLMDDVFAREMKRAIR